MKKSVKAFFTVTVIIIICLSLSACDFAITSVDSLMHPPKMTGDSRLLQQAFEDSVSDINSIIMKNPISGENRSSYLLYDIDCDGVEEGLVSYANPEVSNTSVISVFKQNNGKWTEVSKINGRGEEIYDISFADINGDRKNELVISWTFFSLSDSSGDNAFVGSSNRIMTIYSYNGNSTTLLKTENYTKLFIGDFNDDKSDEILLLDIDLSKIVDRTVGRILHFDNDYAVTTVDSFSLSNMMEIFNISTDTVKVDNEFHTRIFVDGMISESVIITEIIDISHNEFNITLPLYESNTSETPKTLRDSRLRSFDIDNDGYIEIPTLELLENGISISKDNEKTPIFITVWSEAVSEDLSVDFKCLMNSTERYIFIIPEKLEGKITAIYNSKNSEIKFFSLDSSGEIDKEMFSISCFTIDEWEEDRKDFTKFASTNLFIYGYKIFDTEDFDKTIITNNFLCLSR